RIIGFKILPFVALKQGYGAAEIVDRVFHIFFPRLNTSIFMAMTNSINCIITAKLISKSISKKEAFRAVSSDAPFHRRGRRAPHAPGR
ncbi:hypothetical protein, partial [Enterobacter sp. CGMCC 5087]|uniref:hypothetical protein n=1 Tax=Enterobacter sp. CGMCC 5087 TaxID=2183878 RepID=UPI001C629769